QANSATKLVSWSKIVGSQIVGATMIELAQDYEQKNPGYKVLAGINGDYYDLTTKTPVNALVMNQHVIKHYNFGQPRYFSVGLPTDNTGFVSNKTNEIESSFVLSIYDDSGTRIIKEIVLQGLNQIPAAGKTSLYFKPLSAISITDGAMFQGNVETTFAFSSLYLLGSVTQSTMTTSTLASQFTIVTKDADIQVLLANNPRIRVQKAMSGVYEMVDDIMGVGSAPLENGIIKEFDDILDQSVDFAKARHPRTAFGYASNGDIILMTVDGRQTNMAGANLREVAVIMQSLGANTAYNLDGGGSTQMVIASNQSFRMLNSPSDNPYRKVSNGILLVVPDVDVDITIDDITSNQIDVFIEADALGVEITSLLVYLNDQVVGSDVGSYQFDQLLPNHIYYVSVEVTYIKDSVTYTRTFAQKRINLANYYVEVPVVKVKPSNFSVNFERVDSMQGFQAMITFDDPDKTLTKLYLVIGSTKYIALKAIGGYLVEIPYANPNQEYAFQVEFFYRIDTISPISEILPSIHSYTYVGVLTTTTILTTSSTSVTTTISDIVTSTLDTPSTTISNEPTTSEDVSSPIDEPTDLSGIVVGIVSSMVVVVSLFVFWNLRKKIIK
ncbi:MAG: phosphodiester glycosidase family protein, partial [Candidatus Izemoplasmatales bacterium]|nr:phosphodiester glycosidase family protein [Candidatus Izemoplasmatales bacterium]